MEMLEFMGERLIGAGRAAGKETARHRVLSFDAHVDDVLFCASAAGLLATPLLSAAASYF